MSDDELNGDLGVRVAIDTATMDWEPSPSPSVWRKRLHRVGPAESGQVTSVVRYDPSSSFPAHEHPEGEEILVLEGVFTDDRGDWPAGTYLLNPEGYRHAPSSRDGCVIFVKLRQFPGLNRKQVAIDTDAVPWTESGIECVDIKPLYSQPGYSDSMRLERWRAGAETGIRTYRLGAEILVVEGKFTDEHGEYTAGHWIRLPAGTSHTATSRAGCTLYIKEGGFAYLR